jgi:hypothetical protein
MEIVECQHEDNCSLYGTCISCQCVVIFLKREAEDFWVVGRYLTDAAEWRIIVGWHELFNLEQW